MRWRERQRRDSAGGSATRCSSISRVDTPEPTPLAMTPFADVWAARCKGGSMGGNDLEISASALNAPQIETTRLSCTLSIVAVSQPKEVILRGRIVVEVPLRDSFISLIDDVLLSLAVPEEAGLVDDAGSARSDHPGRQDGADACCSHSAQGWGGRRDSGAGTRRLEADTADGGASGRWRRRPLARCGRWRG
jgi:hypothetical protein